MLTTKFTTRWRLLLNLSLFLLVNDTGSDGSIITSNQVRQSIINDNSNLSSKNKVFDEANDARNQIEDLAGRDSWSSSQPDYDFKNSVSKNSFGSAHYSDFSISHRTTEATRIQPSSSIDTNNGGSVVEQGE